MIGVSEGADIPASTAGAVEDADDIMVSVLVTVYNHERYIKECLTSIARQKTSFRFEVLVGEDVSTDSTRAVMKGFEDTLPDNFTLLYREDNLGDTLNSQDLLYRARGRYMALLEGDDFWTDDEKLQRQVDFLESHPDYVAAFHHCTVVGEDSRPNGEKYPDCLDPDYSFKEYFYCCMPGQTGTLVCRREEYMAARQDFNDMMLYKSYPSDRRNPFLFLTIGRVRCFQESWSAYRHVTSGGKSYSATLNVDADYGRNEVLFGETLMRFAEARHNPEALRTARLTYYRTRLKWSRGKAKAFSMSATLHDIMAQRDWPTLLFLEVRWYGVLVSRMLRGRCVSL